MKFLRSLAANLILAASASANTALVDFNNSVPASTAGNYNNYSIPGTTVTAAGQLGSTLNLNEISSGLDTGWDMIVTKIGATGGVGAAGSGADYAGPYPTTLSSYASTSLRDSFFVNNFGVVEVRFSGLDTSKTYDLLGYVARGNNAANGNFDLTVGALGLGGDGNDLTIHAFNDKATDASVIDWRNIVPNSSGEIAFTLASLGNVANANATGINFISLSDAPPPPQPPPTITSFATSDSYVSPGDAITLSWQVEGADTLTISPGVGTVTGNSAQVIVQETTTYTLSATNGQGTTTATVRVAAGPQRPNILFVLVDDMGWQDCSLPFHFPNGVETRTALNNTYRTPNLETLATKGMRFTNACSHPVCTPSRVSLMTGIHPARHHITNWTNPEYPQQTDQANSTLNPPPNWAIAGMTSNETTFPDLLREAGYRTILAGKAHFGPDFQDVNHTSPNLSGNPLNLGFDVNIAGHGAGQPTSYASEDTYGALSSPNHVPGLEKYYTPIQTHTHLSEALTLEMKQAIANSVTSGSPFLAYMPHYAIHAPYEVDSRFSANYPGLSGLTLGHATLIEGMDKSLGDILQQLETLGVAENTLVIFMGDNGAETPNTTTRPNPSAPLRGRKGTAYEGGTRVPLVVAWAHPNPANPLQAALPIPANSHQDDIVTIDDMHATIRELAGLSGANVTDGTSLVPYFRADSAFRRPQEFITHFPHDHNDVFFSTVRQENRKLIHRYVSRSWEYYDLSSDIAESNNLASNPTPENAAIIMRMARRLSQELARYGAQFPTEDATGNVRPLLMPNYPAADTDNDGTPDINEDPNRNGLVDPGETNPDNADTDNDGTPDGAEVRTGTDPLNPLSSFRATPSMSGSGILHLAWPSKPGASYRIEASDNLIAWPYLISSGYSAASAASSTSIDVDTSLQPGRFFRVGLE